MRLSENFESMKGNFVHILGKFAENIFMKFWSDVKKFEVMFTKVWVVKYRKRLEI